VREQLTRVPGQEEVAVRGLPRVPEEGARVGGLVVPRAVVRARQPPQRLPGGVRVPLQVGQRVLVVALELTGAGVTVGGYDGYRSSPLGPRLTVTSYINQESLSEKNPSRLI
jgi:hypothetical protein